MNLTKIPRRSWPEVHTGQYYIDRVFHPDTEHHRALIQDGQIVGAVSYSIEPTYVRVFSLGSCITGGGSRLMAHVERLAAKRGVPVRLAAERSALGFYLKRGYKKLPFQRNSCRVLFLKLG